MCFQLWGFSCRLKPHLSANVILSTLSVCLSVCLTFCHPHPHHHHVAPREQAPPRRPVPAVQWSSPLRCLKACVSVCVCAVEPRGHRRHAAWPPTQPRGREEGAQADRGSGGTGQYHRPVTRDRRGAARLNDFVCVQHLMDRYHMHSVTLMTFSLSWRWKVSTRVCIKTKFCASQCLRQTQPFLLSRQFKCLIILNRSCVSVTVFCKIEAIFPKFQK